MSRFCLTPVLATHQGRRRDQNEDAVGFRYPTDTEQLRRYGAVFVVGDGVGGLQGGKNASHLAVNSIIDAYYNSTATQAPERLKSAVNRANTIIYDQFRGKSATTLTVAVFVGAEAIIAQVGDSRAYWFDGDTLSQITDDQTVDVQKPSGKIKTKLLQALGQKSIIQPDIVRQPITVGGQLLLVTDGITRYFDNAALTDVLASMSPRAAAHELIRQANASGGIDNSGVALIRIERPCESDTQTRQHISSIHAEDVRLSLPDDLGVPPPTPPPAPAPLDDVPTLPAEDTPAPKRRLAWPWMVGGVLLVGGVLGWYTGQATGLFAPNAAPSAAPTVPVAPATALPRTTAPTLSPPPSSTPIAPNTGITSGIAVQFDESAVTYARIGEQVAAFTLAPQQTYLVTDAFRGGDGVQWYRLTTPDNDLDGWIAENDLPNYQVQD